MTLAVWRQSVETRDEHSGLKTSLGWGLKTSLDLLGMMGTSIDTDTTA